MIRRLYKSIELDSKIAKLRSKILKIERYLRGKRKRILQGVFRTKIEYEKYRSTVGSLLKYFRVNENYFDLDAFRGSVYFHHLYSTVS